MRARTPSVIDGVTHWQCSRCERWLQADAYYSCKRSPNGLKAQCRDCHVEGNLRTRDPEKARASRREHMRRARKTDPEKFRERERRHSARREKDERVAARQQVHAALRRGDLVRPDSCSECGKAVKVTAHHDDYSKPLDVRWLCYLCHAEHHRLEAANG